MEHEKKSDLILEKSYECKLSEEQISQLAKEADTSIYVADYETDDLLYLNDSAKEVLHVQRKSISGQKCYEYIMNRTSPCPFCRKAILSSEFFRSSMFKFPLNDHEYQVSSKISFFDNRKVHVHYITDFTNMLNKEKELRELTDKIPSGIGILYVYNDGRIEQVYLNDGYFNMIGCTREERIESSGFETFKVIHPDDSETLKIQIRKCIETTAQINCDLRLLKNDGNYMWINIRADVYEKDFEKSVLYCAFTDVDQLKNALKEQAESRFTVEKLLIESQTNEKRFKSIMGHVPGAMVVFEVRDRLLSLKYISDACITITGYTAEETYERCRLDPFIDTQLGSRTFYIKHESEDIQKKNKIFYRYQLRSKSGVIKWVSLNLSPVEEDGRLYYYGLLRDLDVEEKKYQEHEDYYNQLISIMDRTESPTLVAKGRYDLNDNIILYYKQSGREALKLRDKITFDDARELMVKTAASKQKGAQIHNELNRERLQEEFNRGKTEGLIEYKRSQRSGTFFWSDLSYTLCLNPANKHLIFFVYTHDVTKKVLEKSMLETLSTTEYEVMGTIDVKTCYFETQAVTMPGVSFNKTDDMACGDYQKVWASKALMLIPEYEQKQYLEQIRITNILQNLKLNKTFFMTYSVREPDGSYRRKKMQYCFLDDSQDTIFFYRSDITDTYAKEQQQIRKTEKALQIAKEANDSKTQFFSRMSHDMRTPMNVILGLAELSMKENDVSELKSNISKIKESGNYLLSLINDTLDFQRIESGKMELDFRPFFCRTLIESVLDMAQPSISAKNINFTVTNVNTDWDCYLMLDPVRSRQIFVNLLSNAVKFTPNCGMINVSFEKIKQDDNIVYIRCSVCDTGIGMSEDFLKNKLFHPFSQEESDQSIQYVGTGLGLSIVHSLVEMMDGKIEVESELGTGTTISVYLHFQRVENANILAAQEKTKAKLANITSYLNGKKILLAEDHPLNAEIAKKLLEKVGCTVTWVKNGIECLDNYVNASKGQYDIILMDIRMPEMDGLTAAKEIRSLKKDEARLIPILAMTANAYDSDVKDAIISGMNGHISKPIVPKAMYEAIATTIQSASSGQAPVF